MTIFGKFARHAAAGVGAAALAGGLLFAATPANAAGESFTLTVGCAPVGGFELECTATPHGGTPDFHYHWADTSVRSNDVFIRCNPGQFGDRTTTETVDVDDATGTSVVGRSLPSRCNGGPFNP